MFRLQFNVTSRFGGSRDGTYHEHDRNQDDG